METEGVAPAHPELPSPPMLHAPLPQAPEDAASALSDALSQLRTAERNVPREDVLGAFRRHLARIQQSVRDDFETYRMAGVRRRSASRH